MSNSLSMDKTINILGAMVAAVNNIRLYPPTSPLILNSIEKAFSVIQGSITQNKPLLIAESDNNLLISGEPLSFKLQQFPQVSSFKAVLTGLRIRSVILKKEMDKGEFRNFLMVLSKTPDDMELEGGIHKAASKANLTHIAITPALNAPDNNTRKVPETLERKDLDLVTAFLGERTISEKDYLRLGEKAVDSGWVTDFFKAAIIQIKEQGLTLSDDLLPDTISKMVQAFARSTPRENWGRISTSITRALSEAEPELFAVVMVKNLEGGLFDTLVKSLTDDQFVDFFADVSRINEVRSYSGKTLTGNDAESFEKALGSLKKNQKTKKLKEQIKGRIFDSKKKEAIDKAYQESAVKRILKGDLAPLSDKRVMDALPESISNYYAAGKADTAMNVINRIADGLLNESLKIRSLSSSSLLSICEQFFRENRRSEISKLAHRLNIWVKFETEVTFNFQASCQLLQTHVRDLISHYQFSEANTILETFSFIYHGQIRKSEEIRELAGSVMKKIATDKIFKIIFDEFITNQRDEGKNAYYTLIRLGHISVVPLLDLLRTSEDMSQRVRIINAVTEIGKPALPAVIERIQAGSSWFYMRNLIKLLSEMGSSEHLDILKGLLTHANDKIPKAALNCAFDIGGQDRTKFFFNALNTVTSDSVKSVAADLIGKLGIEDGVYPLSELLKEKATGTAEAKNELDIAICGALKRIGSKKAIPALKAIATAKGLLGISAYSPELRSAASDALKYLQNLPTKPEKEEVVKLKAPEPVKPAKKTEAMTDDLLFHEPSRIDALVTEYMRQKNKVEAVRLLFRMTVRFAKEKNFKKAEELREKLFQVDPMALSEIVKTGDIIEDEKNNAVVNDYLNIWGNLYEQLTPDEANALFYSIKALDMEPDQVVISQHAKNSRLYFINRGQMKIVYKKGTDEFFLKMLGAGDIAGEESFFNISLSTVSLVTLSRVKAGYIDRDTLKELSSKFPQIEEKLITYCHMDGGINALVSKKGLERRQQKRVTLAGRTLVQLLDTNEKPMGKPFRGSIMDISTGGISFVVKTSNKDMARLMLGRKLHMAIGILTKEDPIQIAGRGTIIGAKEKKKAGFSLHLKFDNPILETKMIDIVSNSIEM